MINVRRLNQAGDTIVEVLICLAVLGLMISSAYTLAGRSQTANLQAQERGVATNLVNKQVELLRAYVDSKAILPTAFAHFCLKDDLNPEEITDTSNVGGSCKQNTLYDVIMYAPAQAKTELGAADGTYGILIRWDSASGRGQEEVRTFYAINTITAKDFDNISNTSSPPTCTPPATYNALTGTCTVPFAPPATHSITLSIERNSRANCVGTIISPEDVEVRLDYPDGSSQSGLTNFDGNIVFSGLPDGIYTAVVVRADSTLRPCKSSLSVTVTGADVAASMKVHLP